MVGAKQYNQTFGVVTGWDEQVKRWRVKLELDDSVKAFAPKNMKGVDMVSKEDLIKAGADEEEVVDELLVPSPLDDLAVDDPQRDIKAGAPPDTDEHYEES